MRYFIETHKHFHEQLDILKAFMIKDESLGDDDRDDG